MTSAEVADAFTTTKNTLIEAGMSDDFFADVVASRLVVERIGESKNMDWWESRVLSKTGRTRMSEVTPKTQLKAQINLALKVGQKAESDRLPEDSISLFSFSPQIGSRLTAAIDELEGSSEMKFESLEDLSIQSLEEGWTNSIITETASTTTEPDIIKSSRDRNQGESYQIEEGGYTQSEVDQQKRKLLTNLLKEYGHCTSRLQVPYYVLVSELKSEKA